MYTRTETAAEKRKRINDNKVTIGGSTSVAATASTAETPAAKGKRLALSTPATVAPSASASSSTAAASTAAGNAQPPAASGDVHPIATTLVSHGMMVNKPQLISALATFYAVHNTAKSMDDFECVADWCFSNWDLHTLVTTYKADFTPFLRAVVQKQ